MIYADTSCLLKVLRPEPLSEAVWSAINEEVLGIVSVLAELETLVQLKADRPNHRIRLVFADSPR